MPGPYTTSDTKNYLGFGKQSVKGTGVAPTQWVAAINDVELDHAQEISGLKELGGAGSITLSEKIGHSPKGGFGFRARPSIVARLYAYLLGVDAVTGSVDPFTHTLTHNLVTTYLTVEQDLADAAIERFIDSVVSEMTCEVSNADTQILRLNGRWIGTAPAWQATPTTASYEAATTFVLGNAVWTVDGAGATNVQRCSITATMRIAAEKLSDVVPAYLIKLGLDVHGEIEQLILDVSTEYRKVQYGSTSGTTYLKTPTPGSLVADYNFSAPPNRQLKFEVPNLDWLSAVYSPLNAEGAAEKVTRTFHGRAAGATPIFRVTAQNADSAAYV